MPIKKERFKGTNEGIGADISSKKKEQKIALLQNVFDTNPHQDSYLVSNTVMKAVIVGLRDRDGLLKVVKEKRRETSKLTTRNTLLEARFKNQSRRSEITELMWQVHGDIMTERIRQNKKWGKQRLDMANWYVILGEEFGEVGQAIQALMGSVATKKTDAKDLYKELVQVAAVAQAAAEQVREEIGDGKTEPRGESPAEGINL